jgi:hypothetical protein
VGYPPAKEASMKRFVAIVAGCAIFTGVTATAASAKTIHLFSHQTYSAQFDANGNPITNPNSEPTVGSYFLSTDNDFKGNHKHHSRKPVATDHVDCTFLDVTSFTARCDAQIGFGGGMVIADRQTLSFAAPKQVFKITAGTGKYRKAKGGTVTVISLGENSNDSDLVVRF